MLVRADSADSNGPRIASQNEKACQSLKNVTQKINSIQVFLVRSITIKRFVLDGGIKAYGRDDQGEVHFVEEGEQLHVNIRQNLEMTEIIVPLSERFAEYLNLGDASRELLSKVLTTEKVDQFIEALERAGVKVAATAVEDETKDSNDGGSGDTLPGLTNGEDLESTFGQLQLGKDRDLSNADSKQLRISAVPITTPTLVSRVDPDTRRARALIESLNARLSNATLFDNTREDRHLLSEDGTQDPSGKMNGNGGTLASSNSLPKHPHSSGRSSRISYNGNGFIGGGPLSDEVFHEIGFHGEHLVSVSTLLSFESAV